VTEKPGVVDKPVTKTSGKIGSCKKEQEEKRYLFRQPGLTKKNVIIGRN
jgi:hypothetical protein